MIDFYQRLMERIRGLPGVTDVSAITTLLLSDTPNSGTFTLEDRQPFSPAEQIQATTDVVSPDFFRTMRVPLKYGRHFDQRDRLDSPRSVIVNSTFAEKYWPGRDPVGKRFVFGTPNDRNPWITIVGVVEDMHRRGLHRSARLETFFSLAQRPAGGLQVVIATTDEPLAMTPVVRSEIRALDSIATVTRVTTVADEIRQSMAARRFQAMLLALFAALALLLAAVGIFGLMYQLVTRRTHEIGVRMALGAPAGNVVRMVLQHGLVLTAIGAILGVIGALLLSRVVRRLLFGIGPADPASYLAAVLLLGGVALLACWLPARRAARVDPLLALRHE